MDCNLVSHFKPPIIKRFLSVSVNINALWTTGFYIAQKQLSIIDAGDLTNKDIYISVASNQNKTVWWTVDNIVSNIIALSFVRPFSETCTFNIVVYIYDRD